MGNKIRYYREKRGLSHRQLADAVGASEREIQGVETGMPAKLELAILLAKALGVEVRTLFPRSSKGLDSIAKKGDLQEALSDEKIEDSLLKAGIELDPAVWTARVLIRGGELRLYPIGVSDRKRVGKYLGPPDHEDNFANFFQFTSDDRRAAQPMRETRIGFPRGTKTGVPVSFPAAIDIR